MKLHIFQFFRFSCRFLPRRPKYLPHHPTIERPQPLFLPYVRDSAFAMKAYSGSRGVAPHILNLGTGWRWMVSFTTRQMWMFWKEKNVLPVPEFEPRIPQPLYRLPVPLSYNPKNYSCALHTGIWIVQTWTTQRKTKVLQKLILGWLHQKRAVQCGFWVPSGSANALGLQNLTGRTTFRILTDSSQQSGFVRVHDHLWTGPLYLISEICYLNETLNICSGMETGDCMSGRYVGDDAGCLKRYLEMWIFSPYRAVNTPSRLYKPVS